LLLVSGAELAVKLLLLAQLVKIWAAVLVGYVKASSLLAPE
jgi:hypothetical protein